MAHIYANLLCSAIGKVLKQLNCKIDKPRAKTKKPVPDVLSREKVNELFKQLRPPYSPIAELAYGCGLRRNEVMNLRVQDFNLDDKMLTVCFKKGEKSR